MFLILSTRHQHKTIQQVKRAHTATSYETYSTTITARARGLWARVLSLATTRTLVGKYRQTKTARVGCDYFAEHTQTEEGRSRTSIYIYYISVFKGYSRVRNSAQTNMVPHILGGITMMMGGRAAGSLHHAHTRHKDATARVQPVV